ncbi:MAG: hypothetical protein M5U08_02875 [Burkholderiales bacterium]|nr:hypothetical protein [Burkholderiales bacterium]
MTPKPLLLAALAAALAAPAGFTFGELRHDPTAHGLSPGGGQQAPAADQRQPVRFPPELREHTLANMRDHLRALQEIQAWLATAEFDRAAEIAERRLGMSSLPRHGAHDVAPYMPQGMQDAGTAMHRSASRPRRRRARCGGHERSPARARGARRAHRDLRGLSCRLPPEVTSGRAHRPAARPLSRPSGTRAARAPRSPRARPPPR